VLILGLALEVNAAAQSRIVTPKPTVKPTIKLAFKLPDLWIPSGQDCLFGNPTLNSTAGIVLVGVGNKGKGSAPSSSLRVREERGELEAHNGPWKPYKEWWATVPALAPGQQVLIKVQASKWSGGFDSKGKPIKHPRRWFMAADGKNKVLEANENNNGGFLLTLN
jgi:hypothetical protein